MTGQRATPPKWPDRHGDEPRDELREARAEIQVERGRTAPVSPWLEGAVGIVIALVVLAIVKPWSSSGDGPRPSSPTGAIDAVGSPRPTPATIDDVAEDACLGTTEWQAASLEQWMTQDVRVWRALSP